MEHQCLLRTYYMQFPPLGSEGRILNEAVRPCSMKGEGVKNEKISARRKMV